MASIARAEPTVSSSALNRKSGYQSSSTGSPVSRRGAQVTISAEQSKPDSFGGMVFTTDAGPWRNDVVRVSAVVDAKGDGAKPWIWLRADGDTGKSLKFTTSAVRPLPADGRLKVDLRIPPDAARIAFGVAMRGQGKTSAQELRLGVSDYSLPGNEASAEQVYSEALRVVLDHAYRRGNLPSNLEELKVDLSNQPGTGYQAEQPVRALLKLLDDSHSTFRSAEDAYLRSVSGGDAQTVSVRLVGGDVGYALMPGVGGSDRELGRKFAVEVDHKLMRVNVDARCGWIVDLRSNTGGNMWSMISALGMFFEDEAFGGFKSRDGSIDWWSLQGAAITPVAGTSRARDASVAVLLGPHTASAGEAVAVSFRGRENTMSFGAATRGLATANKRFQLPDGSAIFLTTAVDVDRSGQEMGGGIVPDVLLSADDVASSDIPEEALNWLHASCAHQ